MKRKELLKGMDEERVLFGLFFALSNRLQVVGDNFYEEITCKQFFLLICLTLFQENAPTINEISEVMGSSHQNVKQIINKLAESGFVKIVSDNDDKRKLRIVMTNKMDVLKHKYMQREIDFMNTLYSNVSKEEISITLQTIQKIEDNLIYIKENKK